MRLLPASVRRLLSSEIVLRASGAEDETASPWSDFWYQQPGMQSHTGLRVTPQSALGVSAFFGCVKVISETLAMLPLGVFERTGETSRQRAVNEPTYRLLHTRPNAWQTPYDFKECLTAWAAIHGNGYARKVFGRDGTVVALIPIHPTLVRLELVAVDGAPLANRIYNPDLLYSRADDGEGIQIRYLVRQPDGTEKVFVQGEMLHVRGISLDAIGGVVISTHAREAIGLAQAMEAFGARYFANDLTVGSVLEHPGQLSEKAFARLKKHIDGASGVMGAFKRMILEEGMKLSRQEPKATDAQLIEGRLHQVIEICRLFRMPPHKIQHLSHATFTNIEHQGIEFGTDTMQPWAVRWEQAVSRDLIVDDERYFAEVSMNALMRGDAKTRGEYYTMRFNVGSLSPNQIRAFENENPAEGGDRYYVNAATVVLDAQGTPQPPVKPPVSTAPTATASFAVLLADAAERIVLAESRELEKRTAKRAEDPARFAVWADEFYAAHERYIARTLAPISRAWVALGGEDPHVESLAAGIAATRKAAAINGTTGAVGEITSFLSAAFLLRPVLHAA